MWPHVFLEHSVERSSTSHHPDQQSPVAEALQSPPINLSLQAERNDFARCYVESDKDHLYVWFQRPLNCFHNGGVITSPDIPEDSTDFQLSTSLQALSGASFLCPTSVVQFHGSLPLSITHLFLRLTLSGMSCWGHAKAERSTSTAPWTGLPGWILIQRSL